MVLASSCSVCFRWAWVSTKAVGEKREGALANPWGVEERVDSLVVVACMLCYFLEACGRFPSWFSLGLDGGGKVGGSCQNLEVVRGYGVTDSVHRRSFRADKTRLQLVCCALVQEPGCLVISEGRSPECGTGFRNGLRELWRVKQEE